MHSYEYDKMCLNQRDFSSDNLFILESLITYIQLSFQATVYDISQFLQKLTSRGNIYKKPSCR